MLSWACVGRCVRDGNVCVYLICIENRNRSLKIEMYQHDSNAFRGWWVWLVVWCVVYSTIYSTGDMLAEVGWRNGRVCGVVGPGVWFDGVQLVWSEP